MQCLLLYLYKNQFVRRVCHFSNNFLHFISSAVFRTSEWHWMTTSEEQRLQAHRRRCVSSGARSKHHNTTPVMVGGISFRLRLLIISSSRSIIIIVIMAIAPFSFLLLFLFQVSFHVIFHFFQSFIHCNFFSGFSFSFGWKNSMKFKSYLALCITQIDFSIQFWVFVCVLLLFFFQFPFFWLSLRPFRNAGSRWRRRGSWNCFYFYHEWMTD